MTVKIRHVTLSESVLIFRVSYRSAFCPAFCPAFCRTFSSGITQRYKKIVDFDKIRKKHVTHFNFTVLFGGGTSNENEYSSIIDGILDNKLKRNPSIIMLDYVVSIRI